MHKTKISKKEVKQKVLSKMEDALQEFTNSSKNKKFAKLLKKASGSLADFIVHHESSTTVKKTTKPAPKKKAKSKKSLPKKTVKAK